MIVIEGELQLGERTVRKGHYFFVPAGYTPCPLSAPSRARWY